MTRFERLRGLLLKEAALRTEILALADSMGMTAYFCDAARPTFRVVRGARTPLVDVDGGMPGGTWDRRRAQRRAGGAS